MKTQAPSPADCLVRRSLPQCVRGERRGALPQDKAWLWEESWQQGAAPRTVNLRRAHIRLLAWTAPSRVSSDCPDVGHGARKAPGSTEQSSIMTGLCEVCVRGLYCPGFIYPTLEPDPVRALSSMLRNDRLFLFKDRVSLYSPGWPLTHRDPCLCFLTEWC